MPVHANRKEVLSGVLRELEGEAGEWGLRIENVKKQIGWSGFGTIFEH